MAVARPAGWPSATGPGAVVSFSAGAGPASVANGRLWICFGLPGGGLKMMDTAIQLSAPMTMTMTADLPTSTRRRPGAGARLGLASRSAQSCLPMSPVQGTEAALKRSAQPDVENYRVQLGRRRDRPDAAERVFVGFPRSCPTGAWQPPR